MNLRNKEVNIANRFGFVRNVRKLLFNFTEFLRFRSDQHRENGGYGNMDQQLYQQGMVILEPGIVTEQLERSRQTNASDTALEEADGSGNRQC